MINIAVRRVWGGIGMRRFLQIALALFALCRGIEVMAASSKPVLNATSAGVTLLIFSGRLDPSWTLTTEKTAELLHRLQALALTDETPPVENLGIMHVNLYEQDKLVGTIEVWCGVATLEDMEGRRFRYSDPERQFESWLVNTGSGQMEADVLRVANHNIANNSCRRVKSLE